MNLTALLPDERGPEPVFWRATVIGVDPLRVERDTQGVMGATPENFAGVLRVGDRVFGATINTRSIVFGKAGIEGQPYAMAAGSENFSASGGIGEVSVTFPVGRFTEAPIVTATGNSAVTALENVQVASVTKSGFRLVMQRSTSAATTVYWQAVQMTPTSAEG